MVRLVPKGESLWTSQAGSLSMVATAWAWRGGNGENTATRTARGHHAGGSCCCGGTSEWIMVLWGLGPSDSEARTFSSKVTVLHLVYAGVPPSLHSQPEPATCPSPRALRRRAYSGGCHWATRRRSAADAGASVVTGRKRGDEGDGKAGGGGAIGWDVMRRVYVRAAALRES
jgi:hypothetical protein